MFYAVRHLSMYDTLQLTEFESPDLYSAPGFFVVVPLAAAAALLFLRKRPSLAVLTCAFAIGGFFAMRVAFKFYLIAAPTLAVAGAHLRERHGQRAARIAAVLLVGTGVAASLPAVAQLRIAPEFDAQLLPVRAVEFARKVGLDGRVWNGFTDGGYVQWALPEVPAFQDARVLAYDAEFFHAQQRAESSPESFQAHLRSWDVEWVLTTNVPGGLTGNGLIRGPDWALVYWDELNEIYVRRDVARLARIIEDHEFRRFTPWLSLASLIDQVRSAPPEAVMELEREVTRFAEHASPDIHAPAIVGCVAAVRLGQPDASSRCEAVRERLRNDSSEELLKLLEHATAMN